MVLVIYFIKDVVILMGLYSWLLLNICIDYAD